MDPFNFYYNKVQLLFFGNVVVDIIIIAAQTLGVIEGLNFHGLLYKQIPTITSNGDKIFDDNDNYHHRHHNDFVISETKCKNKVLQK